MRILVIPSGADVVAALRDASSEAGTWVSGTGTLESAQIRVTRDDPVATLHGPLSLLALNGPAAGALMATVARRGKRGEPELVGGQLLHARSGGVTAVLLDAGVEARSAQLDDVDPDGAAPESGGEVARDTQAARGGGARSWGEVATAVARAEGGSARSAPAELPRARDRIDHPAFGECEVLLVRGDRAKVRAVRGASRLREISLTVFRVHPPEARDGVRVFKLSKLD